MIKVLLDCRMADWAGIGRYTHGLARALAAREDVRLVQVCRRGGPVPAQTEAAVTVEGDAAPGVAAGAAPREPARVARTRAHPFSVRGSVELAGLVRSLKPDVVHCAHFPTPRPVTRPLVVTLHDLLPLTVPGLMASGLKRVVYGRLNARAARVADRIVVPSQATAADVARFFPAAKTKTVVIPEAADDFVGATAATAVGAPVSGEPGLAGSAVSSRLPSVEGPYLLAIGNTRPHKDIPTLLRAFAVLANSGRQELRLVLVGEEPPGYVEGVIPEASTEVRARIKFVGRVDDRELGALYAAAEIFVFPSHHEGFGLPPLEAMAMGAPVVAADALTSAEVLGDAAAVFPAGDQQALVATLDRLLSDQEARAGYARAGRERAACFSWTRTATETVAVYEEILDQAREGGIRRLPDDRS